MLLPRAEATARAKNSARAAFAFSALRQVVAACRPREMYKLGRSGITACLRRSSAALRPQHFAKQLHRANPRDVGA